MTQTPEEITNGSTLRPKVAKLITEYVSISSILSKINPCLAMV